MKKQLEAELVSLAHRILQLKNREDIEVLFVHAQKLYEALAVLRFAETHLQSPQPSIGLTEITTALENAQEETREELALLDRPSAEEIAEEFSKLQSEIKVDLQETLKADLQREIKANIETALGENFQQKVVADLAQVVQAELQNVATQQAEALAALVQTAQATAVNTTPITAVESEETSAANTEEIAANEMGDEQVEAEETAVEVTTPILLEEEPTTALPAEEELADELEAEQNEEEAFSFTTYEAAPALAEDTEESGEINPICNTIAEVSEHEAIHVESPFEETEQEVADAIEEESDAIPAAPKQAATPTEVDFGMSDPILHTLDVDFFVPVNHSDVAVNQELEVIDEKEPDNPEVVKDNPFASASIDDLFQAFEPVKTEQKPAEADNAFLTFDFAPETTSTPDVDGKSSVESPLFNIESTPTTPPSAPSFEGSKTFARALDHELRPTLNERLSKGITIGLNDRVAYIKHLFNNSSEDYNRVLSQLMTLDTVEEARDFIEQMVKPDYNNWVGKEEFEARFVESVEKRFL